MDTKIISKRLKELRNSLHMTQQQFADYIGITYAAYITYENRNRLPTCETVLKIADKLDVSLDYLIGRVDEPQIAILEDLPEELKVEGIKAVYAVKEVLKSGLTAAEINEILTFAKNVKKK